MGQLAPLQHQLVYPHSSKAPGFKPSNLYSHLLVLNGSNLAFKWVNLAFKWVNWHRYGTAEMRDALEAERYAREEALLRQREEFEGMVHVTNR
jgi:hypothetical protein